MTDLEKKTTDSDKTTSGASRGSSSPMVTVSMSIPASLLGGTSSATAPTNAKDATPAPASSQAPSQAADAQRAATQAAQAQAAVEASARAHARAQANAQPQSQTQPQGQPQASGLPPTGGPGAKDGRRAAQPQSQAQASAPAQQNAVQQAPMQAPANVPASTSAPAPADASSQPASADAFAQSAPAQPAAGQPVPPVAQANPPAQAQPMPAAPAEPYNEDDDDDELVSKPWLTRIGAVIFTLSLIFLILVFIWWFFSDNYDHFFDSSVQPGQANYKSEAEIQAELNKIVEEGMLNISIASVIEFETATSPGTAYIENSPANHYVMTVTIALDDTGEIVYQSRGMKPDTYIETITLAKPLPAGNYPATATFTAYDLTTLEEEGQAAAKIIISVLS